MAASGADGLHITAGNSIVKGLVINQFGGWGIRIGTNGGNYIQGNYIGTDPTGTIDLGNGQEGITIYDLNPSATGNYIGTDGDGINDASEGNLISGNGGNGILIAKSDDNTIAGNFIGTDATGTVAIPNDGHGINGCENTVIGTDGDGLSDEVEGNLISGNSGGGVLPRTNCVVAGPEHIKPEWYFIWAFRWLKLMSDQAAVITQGMFVGTIIAWPLIDGWIRKRWPESEASIAFGAAGMALLLLLTVWEAAYLMH